MAALLVNYRLILDFLPEKEVSLYVVALSISALGTLLCSSGLGSSLLRRFSVIGVQGGTAGPLLRQAFFIAVLAWGVFSSLLLYVSSTFPSFFNRPIEDVATLLTYWVLGRCVLGLVSEVFRGMQLFGLTALCGGQQEGPLVNLSMTAFLMTYGRQINSARELVFVHLGVTVIFSLLAIGIMLALARRLHGRMVNENMVGAKHGLGGLLAESSKVLASQFAIFGITEIETILIGRYCTDTDVNSWGIVRRLISVVGAPLLIINASIPSFVAQLYDSGNKEMLQRLLRGAATLSILPALIGFFGIAVFGRVILEWFDEGFGVAANALLLLAAANVVFVGAGSAGVALRMSNHQGWATLSTASLAVGYLLVAPTVISTYGIMGAAVLASALIVVRNLVATVLVKKMVGVICLPHWHPAASVSFIRMLRNRSTSYGGGENSRSI